MHYYIIKKSIQFAEEYRLTDSGLMLSEGLTAFTDSRFDLRFDSLFAHIDSRVDLRYTCTDSELSLRLACIDSALDFPIPCLGLRFIFSFLGCSQIVT